MSFAQTLSCVVTLLTVVYTSPGAGLYFAAAVVPFAMLSKLFHGVSATLRHNEAAARYDCVSSTQAGHNGLMSFVALGVLVSFVQRPIGIHAD